MNEPDSAILAAETALTLSEKINLNMLLPTLYEVIGNAEFQKSRFRKAIQFFEKSLELAKAKDAWALNQRQQMVAELQNRYKAEKARKLREEPQRQAGY